MTPTIDQIEAALPYVPAGLHCGDLTEPDERREFAEVIHGVVVAARRPELNASEFEAIAAWVHREFNYPHPVAYETARRLLAALCAPESDETDPSAQSPQNDPQTPHRRNNGVPSWPPPHPTDMSIAWGISEALIEEAE